jgi:PAS domain S-box-containing protein
MTNRQFFQLLGLAMLGVFLLSAGYVFIVEGLLDWLFEGAFVRQTPAARWAGVLASTLIAGFAVTVAVLASPGFAPGHGPDAGPVEDAPDFDYQAAAETAQDAIICADEEGAIVAFNQVAEAMFGYQGEETLGRPLTMLIPERYRAAHADGLARVSAGGEQRLIGSTVELTGLRDTGAEFPLELSLSTWISGRQRGYTAIIRDITERRRREAALRESEERLRRLLETAPDAVVVIDAGGRIVSWNPAAQALFGYPEEEALGADVSALMPVRYRAPHRAGMQRFVATGTAHLIGRTVPLHGLHKDGSEFPLELSLGTWTAGQETFFSAIIRARAPQPPGSSTQA